MIRTTLGLDLEKMAGAALGAGLVFLVQPEQPDGHGARRAAVEELHPLRREGITLHLHPCSTRRTTTT